MKISDSQLTGMLAAAFNAPSDLHTPEAVLDWAQQYADNCHAPFSLRDVRVVYERLPVLSAVAKPTNSQLLVRHLTETEDSILLVSDMYQSGKESLFFATVCDHPLAAEWLRAVSARNRTVFVVGARQNRMVVAASLLAFIH